MADLRAAAVAVPAARFAERPAPGEWSGNEVMAHVVRPAATSAAASVRAARRPPRRAPRDAARGRGRPRSAARRGARCSARPARRAVRAGRSPPTPPPRRIGASSIRCSGRSPGARRCCSPACTTWITPASSRRSPPRWRRPPRLMRVPISLRLAQTTGRRRAPTSPRPSGSGVDYVWSAEAWGHDAVTPLAFMAARTSRIRLGTGIIQAGTRTPAPGGHDRDEPGLACPTAASCSAWA